MTDRDEILSKLKALKPQLSQRYGVTAIALFGSAARLDDFTIASDVDVLVSLEKPLGLDFVLLADEIEQSLGRKTDVLDDVVAKKKLWPFIEPDLIYV